MGALEEPAALSLLALSAADPPGQLLPLAPPAPAGFWQEVRLDKQSCPLWSGTCEMPGFASELCIHLVINHPLASGTG